MFEKPLGVVFALGLIFASLVSAGCGTKAPDTKRSEKLVVVASIAPLAMLAREVVGDAAEVHQLVQGADPHHYAPSVNDRLTIEGAPLVVWMGPALESVLARQMALVSAERQLALLDDTSQFEFDGSDPTDPHLWLRPRNASAIAARIAARLSTLDPQQAEGYRQRARDFSRAMANLQKVQDRALWAYKDVPIVSTHKAYSQFFGPAGVAVESLSGGSKQAHGARTMVDKIRREEVSGPAGCLFGEVPANDRDRQTASHLNLGYQALDPLGSTLPQDAGYRALMEKLLADARRCLSTIPDKSARPLRPVSGLDGATVSWAPAPTRFPDSAPVVFR
uniref:metal ABC transporter substrate-binding protein n=1 Tax=Microbulbifer agarilyticus TaxID=260552 RepID=UPI0002DEA769|nr:metal ABC transporter substrate-binding protein [Microbulbifer agarilyticus]